MLLGSLVTDVQILNGFKPFVQGKVCDSVSSEYDT